MKKKLILLTSALFATLASGCDLSNLMNNDADDAEYHADPHVNKALKIANLATVFLDQNDTFSLHDLVSLEEGAQYTLSQYTFESTNPSVLAVDAANYSISAVGTGFAYLRISGPDLNKPYEQTFYVGSIAGNYVPEKALGTSSVNLQLNSNGSFAVDIAAGKYHKDDIAAYHGEGSYLKDLFMFLRLQYSSSKSDEFKSLDQMTGAVQVYDVDQNQITDQFYGMLAYEEGVGLKVTMHFHDGLVTLLDSSK